MTDFTVGATAMTDFTVVVFLEVIHEMVCIGLFEYESYVTSLWHEL